jgi:shikimate dehydrogenase
MASSELIAAVQKLITNSLARVAVGGPAICAIIGDTPSHYSKSPQLWNAAFEQLGMNAVYLPFDVDDSLLQELLALLKSSKQFLGTNVTVPYKLRALDFVDEIDPAARRIGAINTIVRSGDGRLTGHNTDGTGFIESLVQPQPDRSGSFLDSLKDLNVLLLGAGGSARAVAFHVADRLEHGELIICNRTIEAARSLAGDVANAGGRAAAISEAEIKDWVPRAGLIINSTTKGQGGLRKLSDGRVTFLEAYSALAPANPPIFAEADAETTDFAERSVKAARADVEANLKVSAELIARAPREARFYDLVYHPAETVFLHQARAAGHAAMNGQAMIVNQAVLAFCDHICAAELRRRGLDTPETRRQILETMYQAW